MAKSPLNSSSSLHDNTSDSLTDRIAARVINARLAIERQPRLGRGRSKSKASATSAAEQRETKSLHRVFRDLGVTYRSYRSQTGSPVVPELRDAAYRFRADPSLTSLVAVAAFLDDLDLLS
jgi:hypothetical protein